MKNARAAIRRFFVKIFSRPVGWVIDHPGKTNGYLLLAVLAHLSATLFQPELNPWPYLFPEGSEPVTVSLAIVGTGALLAGFAGVVVVFGLQGNSERFRKLRRDGGKELQNNWSSMSSSGFWTMGLSIASSICYSAKWALPGGLLLELSLLILSHGSIRLIWMLKQLISVVSVEDEVADRRDRTRATKDHPFMRNTK